MICKTKKAHRMRKAFGFDEYGIIDMPRKISNVKISRIINYLDVGGCPFCFPHGIECTNSTAGKLRKHNSWKKHRRKQWR